MSYLMNMSISYLTLGAICCLFILADSEQKTVEREGSEESVGMGLKQREGKATKILDRHP